MMAFSPWLLAVAASSGALLLHCALKSSMVLLIMSTFLLLGRGLSAALRHTLWFLTCFAVLLLPVMTVVLPAWQPAFTQSMLAPTPQTSPVVEAGVKVPQREETAHQILYFLAAGHTKSEASKTSFDKGQIVLVMGLGLWLLGAACTGLRYLSGAMAMQRLLQQSEKVEEGEIAEEYQVALHSLGFLEPNFGTPRLFIGDAAGLSVPVTWGALRPIVMLPRMALQWPVACRRAALLHELSHVKRGDWLTQSLASLVSVLYWFHPLVWFVARQLRLESERATDDRVLATGLAAPDYSSFLIEIVRSMNARHRGFMLNTIPLVGTSRLEVRLRSILDPCRNRGNVTRKLAAILALLTASVVIPLASVRAAGGTTPIVAAAPTAKPQSLTMEQKFKAVVAKAPFVCIGGGGTLWQQMKGWHGTQATSDYALVIDDKVIVRELTETLRCTEQRDSVKSKPQDSYITIALPTPNSDAHGKGGAVANFIWYRHEAAESHMMVLTPPVEHLPHQLMRVPSSSAKGFEALISRLIQRANAPGQHSGVTLKKFSGLNFR